MRDSSRRLWSRMMCGLAVTGTAAAMLTGCSDADTFVGVSDGQFTIGSSPFRFVGFNIYDAAATDRYSCRPESAMTSEELVTLMTRLRDEAGVRVVRFWAYQPYTAGGSDWSGVDKVIAAARRTGMRVIPVLEDAHGDCTTSQGRLSKLDHENDTYYTQGYKVPFGNARLSLREYARVIATHYRDEPTIMAWMVMNEAETHTRDSQGRSALVDFGADMGAVIGRAAPDHLVTLGTQSNSAPGTSGRDFAEIYAQPELDFAEVHDWKDPNSPMPGLSDPSTLPSASESWCQDLSAPIACSFALAGDLDKPLLVGEAGVTAWDDEERAARADLLGAKIERAFEVGADGYLVWQSNSENTDGYAVLPGDPLLPVMRRQAETLSSD